MLTLLLLASCASSPDITPAATPDWVVEQATTVRTRVTAQPGGELLLKAIEAHGGLEPWVAGKTLAFDFDYAPVGDPTKRRYSRSRVDLFGRRAVQTELGPDADATMGWDGSEAWITPNPEAFPSDPRFWATTPFYFVGLPWVLTDPGTKVVTLDPVVVPLTGSNEPLPTLKVTYESGVGDAPDDFYVLHLDPVSHRIRAIRYVVSFPGFFPDGGHSPETLMVWSDYTECGGLWFAGKYQSFPWNEGEPGPKKVDVTVANITVGEPIDEADFQAPAK